MKNTANDTEVSRLRSGYGVFRDGEQPQIRVMNLSNGGSFAAGAAQLLADLLIEKELQFDLMCAWVSRA